MVCRGHTAKALGCCKYTAYTNRRWLFWHGCSFEFLAFPKVELDEEGKEVELGRGGVWSGGEGNVSAGARGHQTAEGPVTRAAACLPQGDEHLARLPRLPLHHPLCRRQPAAGEQPSSLATQHSSSIYSESVDQCL